MISGGITATGVIDGENGDNGYSSAVVQLYRRYAPTQVAPTPALPTGALIYTFATGVLSGATASFNGWSQQIPAASADTKLFVTQATATSQDATDEISVNDWSTPVEYVKDGKGIISADILFCLANSQSTAPADGSFTATSFADLNIKSTDANKYVWQCNKTTYTSGSPTYSGKVCLGKVSDFASVVEQYALGTASAATGTWQNNTPPSPTKGSYLWTRTKLSYTGGGETYSPSSAGICLGYYGSDGAPGPEGPQGYGIMLTLTRSYNESQWESISGVGNEENFSYTGDVTLRAGDYFVVKGISTDAHLTHVVTFICTNQTASIVYGICVSAVCDGKQGQKGDTGRMFYLCGTWPLKAPYTRDAYRCPVVYYGGKYWYLDADSEDGTRAPGATGVTIWKEATSFDMVFTDVLFAKEFAMLGSFIVSDDWLISTKGVLGSAESQDYTKFDPAYPDTSVNTTHTVNGTTWTGYNFVPHYAVDGKEGDMYANKAKIKGAIEATSGRVNSLYIGEGVSDSEARIYMKADETTSGSQTKTPLIYGKDSSGNVVFRLGPAVDQPGGAAGTVFSGLAVGYAWISSGGFMVRNPNANQHYAAMAPGAIELQYSVAGGGTAYARIEMTGNGLKIYSQAWPSEGQVSSGCVYKDANGYLRVKS